MANKNKVGGIIDKRFGENDPTMDPEEKMLHRLTQVAERKSRQSLFDLDDDEPGQLTHMGQSLSLDGPSILDDFDEADLEKPEDDEASNARILKRSRALEDGEDEEEDEEGMPERKKSKQEVMKELIAKSKLHKYERQAAKEDDDDLRVELDKELSGIHSLLRGVPLKSENKADATAMK